MKKLLLILLTSVVGFVLVVGVVAAVRSASKPSIYTRRDRPRLKKLAELEKEHPDGKPRAVTPLTEFDFGVLNPSQTSQHTFVIRNDGPVPLELTRGPTTCKCTMADLDPSTIFPGKEGDVRLEWNTGRSESEFRQSAKIYTNDPERPHIDFQIHGKVRRTFYAEQEAVVFPWALPGETTTAQALVLSQEWSAFEIAGITSNIEGLTWQVEPADPQILLDLDAKSGYRILFTSPGNQTDPLFSGSVIVTANAPDGTNPPETIGLSLAGKMRSRLAVFGKEVDENGLVDFGVLAPGQGRSSALVLRVRDDEPELTIRSLKVTPDILKAEVTPLVDAEGVARPALYRLHIELPKDTPPCHHLGVHQGQVVLEVDHPRITGITIKVGFAVKSSAPE